MVYINPEQLALKFGNVRPIAMLRLCVPFLRPSICKELQVPSGPTRRDKRRSSYSAAVSDSEITLWQRARICHGHDMGTYLRLAGLPTHTANVIRGWRKGQADGGVPGSVDRRVTFRSLASVRP